MDSISAPTPPQPIEPPSAMATVRKAFLGPFGLPAFWSLLLYLPLLYGSNEAVHALQHYEFVRHQQASSTIANVTQSTAPESPRPQKISRAAIGESLLFAIVLFLSWFMAIVEDRRIGVYGLGDRHFMHRFLHGAFWGLAALSLLIALLYAFNLLTFDRLLDHGPTILGWGLAQCCLFVLVGLLEEYVFRGYLQFTLTRAFFWLGEIISPVHARAIAFWIASFLTSAFFLYRHTGNPGEDKFGLISVFLAGVVFVVALWRTGSLWWAIGFHMAWDWAQSFLYGVPDSGQLVQGRLFATHASGNVLLSGGTVGPEGSVLLVPVMALVIVVLLYTHPSPQPPLETKTAKLAPPELIA